MASLQPADDEGHTIDPAQPLRGTVACCTSIPPDQRTDIAARVEELGGLHKYDLTPDVTHLIVGAYDTPKYRHVARERPDIKAMDAAWIEDMAHLWKNDEAIDFVALEKKHQLKALEKCGAESPSPLQGQSTERQSLLICLTGFGEQREDIASRIKANGGRYTGDLTRRCTHLIVDKPEGKKYAAAKSWEVYTVTLDWLDQTIERGMILEETRFDPLLPVKEQGIGAWVKRDPNTLGKRSRSFASNGTEDKGVRKLRKTASMKLSSQRNTLWGDILGRSSSMEHSFAKDNISAEAAPDTTTRPQHHVEPYERRPNEGILARCIFGIHGFNDKRHTVLEDTIITLGGSVVSSLREIAMRATQPGQSQQSHRFLVVPQISEASSHPNLPSDDVEIVTEFFLERCLHSKQFIHPSQHVLGRPFPVFPIPGFSKLVVCSAAFTGLDLNQIARSTSQLGAKFEEEFRRTTSVLVCRSLSAMRKEKLKYAIQWGVPIVSADWLWECISTGFNVPIDNFIYPELRDRYGSRTPPEMEMNDRSSPSTTKSNPRSERPPRPKIIGGFDARDFDEDSPEQSLDSDSKPASKATGTLSRPHLPTSADFLVDKSRPRGASDEQKKTPPLAELSGAQLNKSSSPSKQAIAPSGRTRSAPIPGEGFENPKANRSPSVPPPDLSRDAAAAAAAVEIGDGVVGGGDSQTAVDEDEVRRREEAARQQRKESERQALSSKLSDLIQVTAGTVSSDSNSSLAQATSTRPRRRQLLGRAVSNVSNASSAASYNGDGTGSGPRQMTDSLRAAVAAGTDDDDDMKRHEAQPPATQLEYADPEAMQMKQEIMNRMMGKASHEGKGAIIDDATATQTTLGRRSSLRKR
ncbi:hypothetical protein E4U35_003501 [Claviceps purpurea]|nr:hypothetical protein E4U35_003501 [Claviceps purpurea]KAG6255853.1 hypothetical protein E4U23_003358 [Claviceps purpurea]KAG6279633.1 hypothetical protein E4U47_003042 [Claviceps purpurea]